MYALFVLLTELSVLTYRGFLHFSPKGCLGFSFAPAPASVERFARCTTYIWFGEGRYLFGVYFVQHEPVLSFYCGWGFHYRLQTMCLGLVSWHCAPTRCLALCALNDPCISDWSRCHLVPSFLSRMMKYSGRGEERRRDSLLFKRGGEKRKRKQVFVCLLQLLPDLRLGPGFIALTTARGCHF